MRASPRTLWAILPAILAVALSIAAGPQLSQETQQPLEAEGSAPGMPSVVLRDAPLIQMPGVEVPERSLLHEADSNNPLHWDGDTLYLFNNYGHPWRTSGPDIEHLGNRIYVDLGAQNNKMNLWIESTWKDDLSLKLLSKG